MRREENRLVPGSTGLVPGHVPGNTADPAATHLDHSQAPYVQALRRLAARDPMRLAVPGHLADSQRGIAGLLGDALALDIPPLTDGIDADPLGRPTPLDQARALAADAWGARRTWFLTNGASQGNLTACLALRSLGREIVVQRSTHSSVTDGMILADLVPHPVMPHVDGERGMAHGLTPSDLRDALAAHPDAAAVYVVSPSYFGAVSDIAELARIAHAHGVPLVVDEAWGSHFGFHPDLPGNALSAGADLVVSSTHKLGGSLGQSAMLHVGEGSIAGSLIAPIERALRMTSSTSESSLLLASLDLARRDLVTGTERIGRSITALDALRDGVRGDTRFDLPADRLFDSPSVVDVDPLRFVLDVRGTGLTGHQVRHRLFHGHGIHVEMSTDAVIVALVGAGSTFDVPRALTALRELPRHSGTTTHVTALPAPGPRRVSLREAAFAPSEVVAIEEAIGRVSADSLAPYPPGVPTVLPGEVITAPNVEFLRATAAAPHGHVRGAHDARMSTMRVLAGTPS